MFQNNTVDNQDEKQVEDVDTSKTTAETTETTTESQDDVNPYKAELDKVQEIARQKDGALKEERRLRKEAEEKLKAATTSDIPTSETQKEEKKYLTQDELEARLAREKFEIQLERVTDNTDEQKLVRHHYENSIVRTGDVAADLRMAVALANQHVVEQVRRAQADREVQESVVARVSGGSNYTRPTSTGSDPTSRAVSNLLKKIGASDAEKYIGK